MKIWEILKEENVGKIYDVYDEICCFSQVVIEKDECGCLIPKLIKENMCLDRAFSLTMIFKFNFKEYIDWTKVPVDTKILVRESGNMDWLHRHFAKYENGKVYVWHEGRTSWTSCDEKDVMEWGETKLYEGDRTIE